MFSGYVFDKVDCVVVVYLVGFWVGCTGIGGFSVGFFVFGYEFSY